MFFYVIIFYRISYIILYNQLYAMFNVDYVNIVNYMFMLYVTYYRISLCTLHPQG